MVVKLLVVDYFIFIIKKCKFNALMNFESNFRFLKIIKLKNR